MFQLKSQKEWEDRISFAVSTARDEKNMKNKTVGGLLLYLLL